MTLSLDEVHKEIKGASDRGFGRNCGKPAEGLVLDFFKETVFVDASLANGKRPISTACLILG